MFKKFPDSSRSSPGVSRIRNTAPRSGKGDAHGDESRRYLLFQLEPTSRDIRARSKLTAHKISIMSHLCKVHHLPPVYLLTDLLTYSLTALFTYCIIINEALQLFALLSS